MNVPGEQEKGPLLRVAQAFDIASAQARLADKGGYEIVHESAGLEIGVYVLVHVGFAISVLDEQEAGRVFEHLRVIGEIEAELGGRAEARS